MRISIVDDEKILTKQIAKKLENNGFVVSSYTSYHDFMNQNDFHSDFYIVDISLGDGSGFDIIKHLRKTGVTSPILILSGYNDSENIIYGLNIGADDYMRKPFIPGELIARVQALLRRPKAIQEEVVQYKNITIHPNSGVAQVDGIAIEIGRKEFFMLELLVRKAGKIVSRSEIIENAWGDIEGTNVSDNTLNVTISKLRKKIGSNITIDTIHLQGYKLQ